jgi:SpoVK/Ycf46/Vps4 family AAA+-type ATPase
LQWPLVRFDIAAAKGSLVGQSEANIRKALATADAIAPCVMWLDEVEKGIGGYSSSQHTDGGTVLSMVGTLLTWMQEHKTSVLVVATCNDHNKLPAEMLRAGRFDEKFFLDLPNRNEREAVAKVHLDLLKCQKSEGFADMIAEMTDNWTPAEIQQLIKSAARRTKRNLTIDMLTRCSNEIIPISKSSQVIQQMREWASANLRRANDAEIAPASSRKMRGGDGN